MPLGAHVSTAGGLSTCVPRAVEMEAECIQIFLSPPQRWQAPKHSDEQVLEYQRLILEDLLVAMLRRLPALRWTQKDLDALGLHLDCAGYARRKATRSRD